MNRLSSIFHVRSFQIKSAFLMRQMKACKDTYHCARTDEMKYLNT